MIRYKILSGSFSSLYLIAHVRGLSNLLRGVFAQNTLFLGDQLDRADAGSWQIADGGATRKAAAGGISVGDLRVRIVVEP